MMKRPPFHESDDKTFNASAYTANGWAKGIAWHVYGWEVAPDEDTEWSGIMERTGKVVAVMVGDNQKFTFEPEDLTPLEREAYCGVCGQVGCNHDGLERE